MKPKKNWLIPLILTAAAGAAVLQNKMAAAPSISITEIGSTTAATEPPAAPAGEKCAYTWAYEDAPELTGKFSNLVLAFAPEAKAYANLYGEDCVYADGRRDFHVMETDFYVRLPVKDLADEEALGNWMAQVMQVVVNIPREDVKGNYGFVEFWFEKSETEFTIVRVSIQQYKDVAQGKTGVALYTLFNQNQ